jgi:hypothetical protein
MFLVIEYGSDQMGKVTEERVKIRISETAENNFCVAACDGQKVHDRIEDAFRKNRKVELSFAEMDELTPAFLNAAVGQLYGTFPAELIEKNLSFTDLDPEDEVVLKRVMERAKGYFEHAYSCRKAIRDVIGGDDA